MEILGLDQLGRMQQAEATFQSGKSARVPPGEDFAQQLGHLVSGSFQDRTVEADGSWWSPCVYAINGLPNKPLQPTISARSLAEQIRVYKEDQLLSHPGGDHVDLEAPDPPNQGTPEGSFVGRVFKDLKDAAANALNFVKDLFGGSTYRYVDDSGDFHTATRKGLLGNILEFFMDMASCLSFGLFRPDGEPEPGSLLERIVFAGKKIFGEALMDDLVFGMSSSALNLIDDAALAVWNLVEVVPDSTLGSLPGGDKVVTTIFDNGQVLIDYVTDCLPGGEAWMRVHAYNFDEEGTSLPVLYNLTLPERYASDPRWATVRNTPFRKAIETVGSILADLALARLTAHGPRTSKRRQ